MGRMSRPRVYLAALATCLVTLASPSLATAQTTAPAGNSAIDEYLETVPTPSGDARPRKPDQAGGSTLTPQQRAELQAAGPDGETLARVLDATAPAAPAHAAAPTTASSVPSGKSPVAAALSATTGTDDRSALGLLLPAILLASLLGIVLTRARRRRQT